MHGAAAAPPLPSEGKLNDEAAAAAAAAASTEADEEEDVLARLPAAAGSLTNLAKQPAATIQILEAEKALFRALKMKKETPKYGLVYHSTRDQDEKEKTPKFGLSYHSTRDQDEKEKEKKKEQFKKGKIARVLAAKASLTSRVDGLGESAIHTDNELLAAAKAELAAAAAREAVLSVQIEEQAQVIQEQRLMIERQVAELAELRKK